MNADKHCANHEEFLKQFDQQLLIMKNREGQQDPHGMNNFSS